MMPRWCTGCIRYDQQRYEEALQLFQHAIAVDEDPRVGGSASRFYPEPWTNSANVLLFHLNRVRWACGRVRTSELMPILCKLALTLCVESTVYPNACVCWGGRVRDKRHER